MPEENYKKQFLTIADKEIFEQYLQIKRYELSPYHFANIYIWNSLFEIFWYLIDDSLCVFFNNQGGCFMYLSPLSSNIKPKIIKQCFKIMDEFNVNKQLSRIENVPEEQLLFYKNMGFKHAEKPKDYQYPRIKIAELKGNAFKSKRAGYNYFKKDHKFIYLPYSVKYEQQCLLLLNSWIIDRKNKNCDRFYTYMLDDISRVQQNAIRKASELKLIGRIVIVKERVAGYTFGYKLNNNTFCVMFEITKREYKGLSQFIFREFVREMDDYKYINTMDDSGLINLAKVKRSYKPNRLISNFIIMRAA